MIQNFAGRLERFQNLVGIKFQLYNSLFLSLPFYGVDKTGVLLSLFNSACEEGFASGRSPLEIIDGSLAEHEPGRKMDLLFRFVQYIERQVVLFDALEDAAFSDLNDGDGQGTLTHLRSAAVQTSKVEELKAKLAGFSARLVLTAHPTQFYPGAVLGIMNDLVTAIDENNVSDINTLLQQLGRTPFFKKQKPTPFDEASSLIWYLENVFYDAIGNIANELRATVDEAVDVGGLLTMGFWSGGDRDGNPFVTTETTLQVASALRRAAIRSYHRDVRRLKRRLTFANVETAVSELEDLLYNEAFGNTGPALTKEQILGLLSQIHDTLIAQHNGLFRHLVEDLINKVVVFGVYFATLDLRQEASEHARVLENAGAVSADYAEWTEQEKVEKLLSLTAEVDVAAVPDDFARDTLRTVGAVKRIQEQNGADGCHRYIISQCRSAAHVMEVYALFRLAGSNAEEMAIDIVPLFETITDLQHASAVMLNLYSLPAYREHLRRRGDGQTIMLGFSDGTKDGGYLMANWSIYRAKDELTALSREHGVKVIFFDGRGGPPARGGGKTHRFYSSMGGNIANDAIELTIQGQTVSSNFGTVEAARHNIEQLLHAGVYNEIFAPKSATFTTREEELMRQLADDSFAAYVELKEHPDFLDYLSDVSPLRFYAETNIGSRPAKRGGGKLTLDGLRAIPFVGAWSQIKQNVPGFYGVGTALKKMEADLDEIAEMYHTNGFFKALIDNCEMAMQKSDFRPTAFLADDPKYGDIWRMIRDEFELARRYLNRFSGTEELMSDLPVEQQSVRTRERIVQPLVAIQQYALTKLRQGGTTNEQRSTYEKLVIRCSFGIINAGRNSA